MQVRAQKTAVGHDTAQPEQLDPELQAYQEHQRAAARISLAEEARTLVALGKTGVLSTLVRGGDLEGFPSGSVVEYAADAEGRPVFAFSTLSPHTGEIKKDGRCSFTVMAQPFRGVQDGRVNLIGRAAPITDEAEQKAARELYLANHPNSFWIDFGDFAFFRMEQVEAVRIVAGFARAGKIKAEEYRAAQPDPIAPFSAPVAGHMNADHAEATAAMMQHYTGLKVDKADILNIDRLGMMIECKRGEQQFKARLPFPRPATDRKSVKDLVVEMTRAAAAAQQQRQSGDQQQGSPSSN